MSLKSEKTAASAVASVGLPGNAVVPAAVGPAHTCRLTGLGDRFTGTYYIRRAEHRLGPKVGYVTRFNVVRNTA